jgi:hypothetical protein
LWGIALVAILLGIVGAIAFGFWGVSRDCHSWVDDHGYQLVHFDWWAKTQGCEARTPAGDEILHTEPLGRKLVNCVWQLGIFAVGTLPAVGMIAHVTRKS